MHKYKSKFYCYFCNKIIEGMKNIRQFDDVILKMYKNGYSSTYIANYLKVSKSGIIDRLRKYGVIRHTRLKNMHIIGYTLKDYDSKIIELYSKGYSAEHIGKILGIKRASIYYRLTVNNITLRKVKGIKHSQRNSTITTDFFKNKIETEKDNFDYFLGIFASDGNICKDQIRISGIADNNVEFLQHWCNFLDNKVKIHRRLRNNKKEYYSEVVFKNYEIADIFSKSYGIVPNKTFILELPYINWNIVRGAFDGDGCLVKDKRYNSWKFEIVSASEKFTYQLYDFYISEGLKAYIYKEGNLYKINILQKSDLKKVYYKLYKGSSYFLKRKHDKFLPIIQETE